MDACLKPFLLVFLLVQVICKAQGLSHDDAVNECRQNGVIVTTPISQQQANDIRSRFLPNTTRVWTHLTVNADKKVLWTGFYQLDTGQLPWKPFETIDSGSCVAMDIMYEVNFVTVDCKTDLPFQCTNVDMRPRFSELMPSTAAIELDNSTDSLNTIANITTESVCALYCIGDKECRIYSYNDAHKNCSLYLSSSLTGGQNYSNYVTKIISGCATPIAPSHGRFTSTVDTKIGSNITYSCDDQYLTPSGQETGLTTCNNDGTWSELPTCTTRARACLSGWFNIEGSCYKLSDDWLKWEVAELSCDPGSHLLEINSDEELVALNQALLFEEDSFWTAGSDQEEENWYHWSGKFEAVTNINWHPARITDDSDKNDCLAIERFNGQYHLLDTNCTTENRYICEMGRLNIGESGCIDDTWCSYGSTCSSENNCQCSGHLKKVTSAGVNRCETNWLSINGHELMKITHVVPWSVAEAACHTVGATLVSPLTFDIENAVLQIGVYSGYSQQYWTSLKKRNGKEYIDHGMAEFENILDANLPWNAGAKPLDDDVGCLGMQLSKLGLRLTLYPCSQPLLIMCSKIPISKLTHSGVTSQRPPLSTHIVPDKFSCAGHCYSEVDCDMFGFKNNEYVCNLYSEETPIDPNINTVEAIYSIRGMCPTLTAPEHGSIVSSGPTTTVFTCDSLHKIPEPLNDTVTCNNKKFWTHPLRCVADSPPCPERWEQHKESCYLVTHTQKDWESAGLFCKDINSYLVEIDDQEEDDYLSKLLDFSYGFGAWTGGMDKGQENWYRWNRFPFKEMAYTNWYPGRNGTGAEPSGDTAINHNIDCIELKRNFSEDVGRHYFSDNDCTETQPFICETKVFNVGAVGCEPYGVYSCKDKAECIDNKCQCVLPDQFRQNGGDDLPDTHCKNILPVAGTGCLNNDDFCLNISVCVRNKCVCPEGLYQNGQDLSKTTECVTERPVCPDQWRYLDGICYKLFTKSHRPELNPSQWCVGNGGILANPTSRKIDEFIQELSDGQAVWLGLHELHDKLVFTDGRSLKETNYTNWARGVSLADISEKRLLMSASGKWQLDIFSSSKVAQTKQHVCQQPIGCGVPPYIDNGYRSSRSTFYGVGKMFEYGCNIGYALNTNHTGVITCRFNGTVSEWEDPPVCQYIEDVYMEPIPSTIQYGQELLVEIQDSSKHCAQECFDKKCSVFYFISSSKLCRMFLAVSTAQSLSFMSLPFISNDTTALLRKGCGPMPYVKYANAKFVQVGNNITVEYTCSLDRIILAPNRSMITCQSNGKWEEPPVCEDRFTHHGTYSTLRPEKHVYDVRTKSDCLKLCLKETDFRCLGGRFQVGLCAMASHRVGDVIRNHFFKYFIYSNHFELNEASLDSFTPYYDTQGADDLYNHTLNSVSKEECAHACLDLQGCNFFNYFRAYNNCELHNTLLSDGNSASNVTMTSSTDTEVFVRNFGCKPIETTSKMAYTFIFQSYPPRISIGDRVAFQCLNLSEGIAGNTEAVCRVTGHWSRIPVCRSLCEDGWYMERGYCYKISSSPLSFWEAADTCHQENSGLLTVTNTTELSFIKDVIISEGISTQLWIGMFADLGEWRWAERFTGGVEDLDTPPVVEDSGITLTVSGNVSLTSSPLQASHGFVCRKSLPNLRCPSDWVEYNNTCYTKNSLTGDYNTAVSKCASLGGWLATPHSRLQILAIREVSKATGGLMYTGISREPLGDWKFADGDLADFLYYIGSIENSSIPLRQCVVYNYTHIYPDSCDVQRPFHCQAPIDIIGEALEYSGVNCSTNEFCQQGDVNYKCAGYIHEGRIFPPTCRHKECPAPWEFRKGRCVMMTDHKLHYGGASALCSKHGGRVASVDSANTQLKLLDLIQSYYGVVKPFYIGYNNYTTASKEFLGTDLKSKIPDNLWKRPTRANQLCALVMSSKLTEGWVYPTDCDQRNHFICEKPFLSNNVDDDYKGCYARDTGGATLPREPDVNRDEMMDDGLTVGKCQSYCYGKGYRFSGVSRSTVCTCGDVLGYYSKVLESNCYASCPGDTAQNCGGSSGMAVYKTKHFPCSPNMIRNPVDPRICYSLGPVTTQQKDGQHHCSLQGGDLATIEDIESQEFIYQQLLLGLPSRSANTTAHLGYWTEPLPDLFRFVTTDHSVMPWSFLSSVFFLQKSDSYCVRTSREDYGRWHHNCYDSFFICQYLDHPVFQSDITIGLDLANTNNKDQIQKVHIHTLQAGLIRESKPVMVETGRKLYTQKLDFGCINNPSVCPNGFTLMLMVDVKESAAPYQEILSTGDCVSRKTDTIEGLCVFFTKENPEIWVVYSTNGTTYRVQVPVQVPSRHHITIVFDESLTTYVYLDGKYRATLTEITALKTLDRLSAKYDDVLIGRWFASSNVSASLFGDIIFEPRTVTELEISNRYGNFKELATDTSFGWLRGESDPLISYHIINDAGVDGQGMKILDRSSLTSLSDGNQTCLFNLTSCSGVIWWTFWLMVERPVVHDYTLLETGDVDGERGLLARITDGPIVEFTFRDDVNEFNVSETLEVSKWKFFDVKYDTGLNTFFVNSKPVQPQTRSTAPTKTNYVKRMKLGEGKCPLGWTLFGMSCYLINMELKYRSDHDSIAKNLGAGLVDLSDWQEYRFLRDFIFRRHVPGEKENYWLGTYDQNPDRPREWTDNYGTPTRFQAFPEVDIWEEYLAFVCSGNACYIDGTSKTSISAIYKLPLIDNAFPPIHKCPKYTEHFNGSCYQVHSVTGPFSRQEIVGVCERHNSRLVDIESKLEFNFVSQLLMRNLSEPYAHIGLSIQHRPSGGLAFLSTDLRPAGYQKWSTTGEPSTACVALDCRAGECLFTRTKCHESGTLTTTTNIVCEKPAENKCGPGWRSVKGKCVTIDHGQFETLGRDQCFRAGGRPLTFNSFSELNGTILTISDLMAENDSCLTDATRSGDNHYKWSTTGNVTFFDQQELPGSGTVVLAGKNGLALEQNGTQTCVICEYDDDIELRVDDVRFYNQELSNSDLANIRADSKNVIRCGCPMTSLENSQIPCTCTSGISTSGSVDEVISSFNMAAASASVNAHKNRESAMSFSNGVEHLVQESNFSCVNDPGSCSLGLTLSVWVYLQNDTNVTVFDSTHGSRKGARISYHQSKLHVSVSSLNHVWTVWSWMGLDDWSYITVTWQEVDGLKVYINAHLITETTKFSSLKPFKLSESTTRHLAIGVSEISNAIYMTDLLIEDFVWSSTDVNRKYESGNNESKARYKISFDGEWTNDDVAIIFGNSSSNYQLKWENTFFKNVLRVTSLNAVAPSLTSQKFFTNQFTQPELFHQRYTLSFWFKPMNYEQNQTILESVTDGPVDVRWTSWKLSYTNTIDRFKFFTFIDKIHLSIDFRLHYKRWSLIVVHVLPELPSMKVFVNGEEMTGVKETLVPEHSLHNSPFSYLIIGEKGDFYLDDVRFSSGLLDPLSIYVLRSSREYKQAGYYGQRWAMIDQDGDGPSQGTLEFCDLDAPDLKPTTFEMTRNMTDNSQNTSITTASNTGLEFQPGFIDEALVVPADGVTISGLSLPCLTDIKECRFGFSAAMWIMIQDNPAQSLTIFSIKGLDFTCTTNLLCKVDISDSETSWSLDFTLSINRWMHVAITWNQYLGLTVYFNGHSTGSMGVEATKTTGSPDSLGSGVPSSSVRMSGKWQLEELVIQDSDFTNTQIRDLFGQVPVCKDKWTHSNTTGSCYRIMTSRYLDAGKSCEPEGATVATEPNIDTHNWFINDLFTQEKLTEDVHIGYRQFTPVGRFYWLDGTLENYTYTYVTPQTDTSSIYCVVLSPPSWNWKPVNCDTTGSILCEMPALYVPKKELSVMALETRYKYTKLAVTKATPEPGLIGEALRFPNNMTSLDLIDECFTNYRMCHNGLSVSVWLYLTPTTSGLEETVLSTQTDVTSSGLTISGSYVNDEYVMQVTLKTCDIGYTMQFYISTFAWTHLYLSLASNDTSVYLNGRRYDYVNVTDLAKASSCYKLNTVLPMTVGKRPDLTSQMHGLMDELEIFEHSILNESALLEKVSDSLPVRIHQSFDFNSSFNHVIGAKFATGRFGNALFINDQAGARVDHEGQLVLDCLGTISLCDKGFTSSIWLKPLTEQNSEEYDILSFMNDRHGFKIYHSSIKSHMLVVRNITHEIRVTFDLVQDFWSYVLFSWKDGHINLYVNGVKMSVEAVNPIPEVNSTVIFRRFGSKPGKTYHGGIDDFLFLKFSVSDDEAWVMYWNSVFVEHHLSWPFDTITNDQLGAQHMDVRNQGPFGNCASIDGKTKWLNLTTSNITQEYCYSKLDSCVHGFTVSFMLRFLEERDRNLTIITTGGDVPEGLGFYMRFAPRNTTLGFRRYFNVGLRLTNVEFSTWFNLEYGQWESIVMTYYPQFGFRVFIGGILFYTDITGTSRSQPATQTFKGLLIGRGSGIEEEAGAFEIDELNLWDISLEGNVTSVVVEEWFHYVHKTTDITTAQYHPGIDRESCTAKCKQGVTPGCKSFAFCSRKHLGDCYLISGESNPGSMTSSTNCDYFRKLSLKRNDYTIGCYGANWTTNYQQRATFTNSSLDCRATCYPNFKYSAINTDNKCQCSNQLLDSAKLGNVACNITCGQQTTCVGTTSSVSVYATSHVVPFVSPSTAITDFNATFDVGPNLVIGDTLNVDFSVNSNETVAGYKVSLSSDPLPYFTNRQNTSIQFNTSGAVDIIFTAMNELSEIEKRHTVIMYGDIEDVYIPGNLAVAVGNSVTINVTVVGGTSITCTLDFGDGTRANVTHQDSLDNFVYAHTYIQKGTYPLNVTCANMASVAQNYTSIAVQEEVAGLTIVSNDVLTYPNDINITFTLASGSDIKYQLILNDLDVSDITLVSMEDSALGSIAIPYSQYTRTGLHIIKIRASNLISNLEGNANVSIEIPITGLAISPNSTFHAVNSVLIFEVFIATASNVNLRLIYDDGSFEESYIPGNCSNTRYYFNHTYVNTGEYSISLNATNGAGTEWAFSNVTVEVPVSDVTVTTSNLTSPDVNLEVVFKVSATGNLPTSPLFAINVGDGKSDAARPLIFDATRTFTYTHSYSDHGAFEVNVTVYNGASRKEFINVVYVGGPIRDLKIASDKTSNILSVGQYISINANISYGSLVTYHYDFGDGTQVERQYTVSHPYGHDMASHLYQTPGDFVITVHAWNSFSNESKSMIVQVFQRVNRPSLFYNKPAKSNKMTNFVLTFNRAPTKVCITWTFGDGARKLVGDQSCANPQSLPFQEASGSVFTVSHKYTDATTYNLDILAKNKISIESLANTVTVEELTCDKPEVNILGFSAETPGIISLQKATPFQITADVYSQCDPPVEISFSWSVERVEAVGNPPRFVHVEELDAPESSFRYITFPSNYFSYGTYRMSLSASYLHSPNSSNSDSAVIAIAADKPVVNILGDDLSTASKRSDLTLDADDSFDPDDSVGTLQFSWFCRLPNESFTYYGGFPEDKVFNTSSGCFGDGVGKLGENSSVVKFPSNKLIHEEYVFIVVVAKSGRRSLKQHRVRMVDSPIRRIGIRCVDNCNLKLTHTQPARFTSMCLSCDNDGEKYEMSHLWQLFTVSDTGVYTEISTLATMETGVTSPSLMIEGNFLTPGVDYRLRLTSGEAYTERKLYLNFPPYNGQCSASVTVGIGFSTKFSIQCSGWLDEDNRPIQNPVTDGAIKRVLDYEFKYRVKGQTREPILLFEIEGGDVTTPEVILRPGYKDQGYLVEIIVLVKDSYHSYTEYNLELKIVPDSSDVLSVYQSDDYKEFTAERDMTSLLTISMGVAEILDEEKENGISENISESKEYTLSKVLENLDWVETRSHTDLLTKLLLRIEQNHDDLSLKSKRMLFEIYSKIIPSLDKIYVQSEETQHKNSVGRGLLEGLMELMLAHTKDSGCQADCADREEKETLSKKMSDFYSERYKLISMILAGAVPGEKAVTIRLEQKGNLILARHDQSTISDTTVTIDDKQVAYIPTSLQEEVDFSQYSNIDLEVYEGESFIPLTQSKEVNTRTTSITLYVDSIEMGLGDLENPIKINVFRDVNDSVDVSTSRLKMNESQNGQNVMIDLSDKHIVTTVELLPADNSSVYEYYVRQGSPATVAQHDLSGVLEGRDFLIRLNVDMFPQGSGIDKYRHGSISAYIFIVNKQDSAQPEVDMRIYSAGCFYYDRRHNTWSSKGVDFGSGTTTNMVECKTHHLTDFGASFFVPPNSINFATVFNKFTDLGNNVAVITTVGVVLGIYFIVVFIVLRMDQKDKAKWSVEPLTDNLPTDVYHYQVTVYTGMRRKAGTKSKVFLVLAGDQDETEIRCLDDQRHRKFATGSVNSYLLSVPNNLGDLAYLRIWHDNSGNMDSSDWYLNLVVVRDIQTNKSSVFLCDRWLSLTKDDGEVERFLPVATMDELEAFAHTFFFKTRQDITDGHIWFSVVARPTRSSFTRVQRLSCCLSLLFTAMIANAMWYRTTEGINYSQNASVGPFTFSPQEFFTSILMSFIVVPVNIIIVTIFRKSKPRTNKVKTASSDPNNHPKVKLQDSFGKEKTLVEGQEDPLETLVKRKVNERFELPHWCVYIAWFLVLVSVSLSGFFTILYSLEWGASKSGTWLTAFLLSFLENIIIVQPVKVVAVSIVLALIFRSSDHENNDKQLDREIYDMVKTGKKSSTDPINPAYPAHRKRYTERTVDISKLEYLREYREKQNRLFGIFQEIIVYTVYVIVIAILCYESRDIQSYREVESIRKLFVNDLRSGNSVHGVRGIEGVGSYEHFWTWCNERMLPGLYARTNYNGDDVSSGVVFLLSDQVHFRVGLPQLRQARVKSDSCTVVPMLSQYMQSCLDDYSITSYDDISYGKGWTLQGNRSYNLEPWTYQTITQLNGLPTVGRAATYGGGGYVAVLGDNYGDAANLIDALKAHRWLDRKTRALFVEVNLYNPSVNLFSIVNMMLEFLPTGHIITKTFINPLRLYRYVGPSAIFIIVLDLLFVSFTLFYMVQQGKVLLKLGLKKYFSQFWNCIETLNLISAVLACAFYGVHYILTEVTLSDFYDNAARYVNFQKLVLWDEIAAFNQAFLLFFCMLKMLRLIRFNSKVTQLAGTLKHAVKPLANFFILFLINFTAFISFGYLVFGSQNEEYATIMATAETLFSMLLMKVDFHPVIETDKVLGATFLFLYVVMVVFVLINMFMSILNDTFTVVRNDQTCLPDDPKLVEFMIHEFKRLIGTDSADYNPKSKTDTKTKTRAELDRDGYSSDNDNLSSTHHFLVSVYSGLNVDKPFTGIKSKPRYFYQ